MAFAFATKPVDEWSREDVREWLHAGFSRTGGWTEQLSFDYRPLFRACDFDGGSVVAMQSFTREEWITMAHELSGEHSTGCRVTFGDQLRLACDHQPLQAFHRLWLQSIFQRCDSCLHIARTAVGFCGRVLSRPHSTIR